MASVEENGNLSRFFLINSTVGPTCISLICITIMIVFSTTKPTAKPKLVVWGTEATMTLLCMLVTFLIWFLVKRNTRKFLIDKQRRNVTFNLKLVFFWTFGLANIFNSALNMGSNIDCLLNGGRQPFLSVENLSIVKHLTEIFFCVGQLGFLSVYGKLSFRPLVLINYGISLIISAHFLRWFRFLLDSIKSATPHSKISHGDCYNLSSIATIHNIMSPYISPMVIEFSLLSVVLIVGMCVNTFGSESIPMHFVDNTQEMFNPTSTSNEELDSAEILTRRTSAHAAIICGIMLSLPFFISFILTSFKTDNSADLFRIISTIYEVEVLALLVFGKWKFKSQFFEKLIETTKSSRYHVILLCITSGAVSYEAFGAIAGLMKAGNDLRFLLFFDKILQIVVIIIQTEIILHTKSITFRRRHLHVKYFTANRIFLCIFVMNILRWIVDSTVMKQKTNASFTQRQFYGEHYWDTIEHTLFPVNVFYRFLAAMEMYELYQTTNQY